MSSPSIRTAREHSTDTPARSKYWLATVDRLLDLYGDWLGIGYDIGCSAHGTIQRSPLLAEKYIKSGSRLAVPAFHGCGHNASCQETHHVRVLEGFGLEDLETCERVFSASNEIARPLRHCSVFTRHQFIVKYFQRYNQDMRDQASEWKLRLPRQLLIALHPGLKLLTKYRTTLDVIRKSTQLLDVFMAANGYRDMAVFETWRAEMKAYFSQRKKEPKHDTNAITYVELLQEFDKAK